MSDFLSSGVYEIILGTFIDEDWSQVFDGFEVKPLEDGTLLTGHVIDQPALHGVLARLRDLGIPIVGVRRISEES